MDIKEKILIADDSVINQQLLSEILGDGYDYAYAPDGIKLIEELSDDRNADLVLLDINMPNMDGFTALEIMKSRHWLEEIPVIVISAEHGGDFVQRAYELGATDYISRPLNSAVVQRRVKNTLTMYARQRRLVQLVEEQVYNREKTNSAMINILSHALESSNNESGSHTLHMHLITSMLLNRLIEISDRYPLSKANVSMIATLSALHDIGKITVPKEILNKPGKLTAEEWEIMKSHTVNGDKLISETPVPRSELLMTTAHAICRWHHERWDGKGYPDGLSGDEIPISAQAVSIADVYDALTSDRCYKRAIPHEQAIQMILNGECGEFNPLLLRCLADISNQLEAAMKDNPGDYDYQNEAQELAEEMLNRNSLPLDDRAPRLLANETLKKNFFAEQCGGIQFEYDRLLSKLTYRNWYEEPGKRNRVVYKVDMSNIDLLSKEDWDRLVSKIRATTREKPIVRMKALVFVNGTYRWHKITARSIWPVRGGEYISVLGQLTDIHNEVTAKENRSE